MKNTIKAIKKLAKEKKFRIGRINAGVLKSLIDEHGLKPEKAALAAMQLAKRAKRKTVTPNDVYAIQDVLNSLK